MTGLGKPIAFHQVETPMAPAALSVEIRTRRLWLLRVVTVLVRLPLSLRLRRAIVDWAWDRLRFEYRSGGTWHAIAKPELELDL